MKCIAFLGVLALMIVSCNHETKTSGNASGKTAKQEPEVSGTDFYKRYNGTLAGQPVVVHLQRIGNKLSGSYYYESQGKYIALYDYDDTANDDHYLLTEVSGNSIDEQDPHWEVTIGATGLTGTWTSGDSSKKYRISLAEQYPEGSYRFDVRNYEATGTLIAGREQPAASFTVVYIQPAAAVNRSDADFITGVIRQQLGCDTIGGNIDDCIKKSGDNYLQDYRNGMEDMDTSDLSSPMNNYTSDQALRIWYNNNGLLVLENFNAGYYGGAHGNYSESFICADVQQRRIWKLEDVMRVDSNALKPLLEIAARDHFEIGLDEKLEERMLVSEVPVTDNFFFSEKGIGFVYNPYEIASYADGAVVLFIPYKKLMPLLTPAFIERMHLTAAAAGTA